MIRPEPCRPGVLVLALALAACGCGDGTARLPLQRASGSVMVDGQPAASVEVRLAPADNPGSIDALRPFATTGPDGTFTLGTYEAGDGAPEGRYKVTLFWPDRPPGPSPAGDRLGGKFARAESTPLEATIKPGENRLDPFEVQAPARAAPTRKPRNVRPDVDGVGQIPSNPDPRPKDLNS